MPVVPTYPGVYIEEVPSPVRTIAGVSTAVTAFVGYTRRGPLHKATPVFNFGEFERIFGGLDRDSLMSYAVYMFFLNGGTEAWIVRTAQGASKGNVTLKDGGGTSVLTVEAANEGAWGNALRLQVDDNTLDPTSLFNLTVTEKGSDGKVITEERFLNLSMDPNSSRYVIDVVNAGSRLIQIADIRPATTTDHAATRPVQTGTTSGDLAALDLSTVTGSMTVSISGTSGTIALGTAPASLSALRAELEGELRQLRSPLNTIRVQLIGTRLRFTLGPEYESKTITFSGGLASTLKLTGDEVSIQPQSFALTNGQDGSPPSATQLRGTRSQKTGLYALEDVDIFNILCLPGAADLGSGANAVYSEALAYGRERRAFLLVDIPSSVRDVEAMKTWLDNNANLKAPNAAIYFPRVRIADPLNEYRPRSVPSSGAIAGLYARTDSTRGVWKAPAGIDASLRGVVGLDYKLSNQETGVLNPLGVNCLRILPVYGPVAWGARTLKGADVFASEWKYVPVRRLALFIEESLYRGTQWVVFEPNDEPLWAQIRLNVGAFMHRLFRQGAFQGATPREAYFVKCDKETTPQDDIDRGIVNILVGFAPLKPAEFVIIKISQITGQSSA